MKSLTFSFLLFITCFISGFTQQSWTNYANDRLIADVQVDGHYVWVGSQGGLTRTNLQTGELKSYLAGNCPIVGGGVSEIEKAPDGAMWFGSENGGVFRFYQDEWTQYYDGIVDSLYEDIENLQILPNGDVWFFVRKLGNTYAHKLIRIRNGQVEAFDGLPSLQYSYCMADETTLYVVDKNAIYQYDVNSGSLTETFNVDNSILESTDEISDLRKAKNGAIIIACSTRLLQLKSGVLTELSQPGLQVLHSFTDNVGNIYFSSYKNNSLSVRLVKYDGNQVVYYTDQDFEPLPVNDPPIFRGGDLATGLYASIFTLDSEYTLYRFDNDGWHPVRSQIVPMLENYQDDVQADCDGNLWFNSRDGIDVRYADGTWENFTLPTQPFTYFLSTSMTVDPNTCDVWFNNTSNSGAPIIPGIIRISNGVVTGFLYSHANVMDILSAPDGKLYFISLNSGFGYIENDQVHLIDGLEEFSFATSLDMDSKGNIYLACWDNKLLRYNGSSFDHLGSGEGGDYVYDVRVDNDDMVWTITSNGFMQFDGVNWHNFNQGTPGENINDIVEDRKGHYWLSTWNDGLYYWDGQTTQHFDIFNSGLTTNVLRKVNLDPHGNLIVTQLVGASVLEIPEVLEAYRGSGNVYFDANKNGVFDSGNDVMVPGQKVKDLTRNLWSVSNLSGNYAFYNDAPAESQFQHQLDPPAQSTTNNPQSAVFTDYASELPDFGFWTDEKTNVQMSVNSCAMICNREFKVQISFQNKGVYPVSGNLVLNFPDEFSFINSSLSPSGQSSGQLLFNDFAMAPFEWKNIKLIFKTPGSAAQGIFAEFESIYQTADTTLTAIVSDTVRCSYDPNDKKVEPVGDFVDHTSLLSDPLKYTIRFQNEGTYKAFDIVILDTLDAHLDPSTFQLLASSHPVETSISTEGIVKFVFLNIDLPARSEDEAGSQGFVSFTIQPDSNLVADQTVFNRAAIYFDFNPPIITNTTAWNLTNDLTALGITEPESNIAVNPNPTDGHLIIQTIMESNYRVWDAAGQLMDAGQLQAGRNSIYVDILPGLYFLEVKDVTGLRMVKKIVRM